MQSDEQSRELKVADPLQVAAFDNPLRCRILIACGAREHSLSDLRGLLDLPFPKLHYHVGRLLTAGLLTISRTQPRAGRPVQFYRAVAERFLVPQDSMLAGPGETYSAELRQSLRDEAAREGGVAVRYGPGPAEGTMKVQLVRAEATSPPRRMELWRIIKLTPQQRMALGKELIEIFERYDTGEPAAGAEGYLVHAALAPRLGGRNS